MRRSLIGLLVHAGPHSHFCLRLSSVLDLESELNEWSAPNATPSDLAHFDGVGLT